ncbi:MAG: amino acid carrier protein [Bacillota bacterium]|jgi:AGCS family alanine or glycine:cation symporter|nr:amino acid carrier protein [Bacillota bacterium]
MDLLTLLEKIAGLLWSVPMVVLCMTVGVIYSVALKFPQIVRIKDMAHYLIAGESSNSGISSFQSFAMALGGRLGIGAIAGVATAVCFGGPGAIFWMWVYAIFGAASAFAEAVLGQIWKESVGGEYRGGPAYYIEKGAKLKPVAITFAIFAVIAFGFTAPAIQAFNIAEAAKNAFGINTAITGAFVAILFGLVVFGGMKRIGRFAEIVVPVMAAGYFIVMIIILVINAKEIPSMFALIFNSAFSLDAVFGGIWGSAILWGVRRAVYSTEAGMGSGAHAAASAEVSHPVKQGLAQAFSVYVDTIFGCTATGLMIMVTGMYNVIDKSGNFLREGVPGVDPGTPYVQAAINTALPGNMGSAFIAIAIFFFAITTILSFGFYVMPNISYLLKDSKNLKQITLIIGVVQMFSVFIGSTRSSAFAWNLADIGVGLISWINLIGLLFLVKPVMSATKDFNQQRDAGLDPVFDPEKCGIHNADLWKDIVKKNYSDLVQTNNSKKK